MLAAERLEAGRVGRPHGLDGSFYVTRALPRLLALGGSVSVRGTETTIVRRAGTDEHPIVRVAVTSSRDEALALRGEPLLVRAEDAPSLDADEYWAHDLEGCRVLDGARAIGVVRRLLELPSCEVLEVERDAQGGELLVPLVRDAIVRVDVAAREIVVRGGFLGLEGGGQEA